MEDRPIQTVRKSSRAAGGWFRKRKYRWLSYVFPRTMLFRTPAKPYQRIIVGLTEGYLGDLGCGVGACAAMYSVATGNRACGMDLKEEALAYGARESKRYRIPVTYILGSVLQTPLSDATFDTVYLGQVIEHIHGDRDVVREAFRIIKPGGKLIISVPRGHSCMTDPSANDGHVNFYETESDCRDLLTGLALSDVHFHEGDNHRFILSARKGNLE